MELVYLEPRPLPVDWSSAPGEEWLAHFWNSLYEHVPGAKGHGETRRGEGPYYLEYRLNGVDDPFPHARLVIDRGGRSLAVEVQSEDDRSKVAIWQQAIVDAFARMGTGRREIEWAGYLGADRAVLAAPVELGQLRLTPHDQAYHAPDLEDRPTFFGWGARTCGLLRVDGCAGGVSGWGVLGFATDELERLAGVLSVRTGRRFRIEETPFPNHPNYAGQTPPLVHCVLHNTEMPFSGSIQSFTQIDVPPGLDTSWERAREPVYMGPVLSHQRGLMLEERDPATALALFAGALDGIGKLIARRKAGAHERFSKSLKLVARADHRAAVEAIYDRRNESAHGEVVEGQAGAIGTTIGHNPFYAAPRDVLRSQAYTVQSACREVLDQVLTEPLEAIRARARSTTTPPAGGQGRRTR